VGGVSRVRGDEGGELADEDLRGRRRVEERQARG